MIGQCWQICESIQTQRVSTVVASTDSGDSATCSCMIQEKPLCFAFFLWLGDHPTSNCMDLLHADVNVTWVPGSSQHHYSMLSGTDTNCTETTHHRLSMSILFWRFLKAIPAIPAIPINSLRLPALRVLLHKCHRVAGELLQTGLALWQRLEDTAKKATKKATRNATSRDRCSSSSLSSADLAPKLKHAVRHGG